MRKLNFVLQEILKVCLLFLFFFVWFRYLFKRNLPVAIIVSLATTLIVYAIACFFLSKRKAKLGMKMKEKEEAEDMFLSLACSDNYMDFFEKLAKTKHQNTERHKCFLTIKHPENVKTLLYADMSFEGLTCDKLIEIHKKVKSQQATKIVIVCKEVADKMVFSLASTFKEKFLILDEYSTYNQLFKYYGVYPEITRRCNTQKKLDFKDFVSYSFNKKRTKSYLLSALVLILSSLFIRMTIYYCIIASVLVVFALVSQFNPRFNSYENKEILGRD